MAQSNTVLAHEVRPAPLTILTEEEEMFRDVVRAFAEDEVRPRVMEMEKACKIAPDLIPKYFDLGLMGIEVPEEYGGACGSLFMVTLAVEEISKVDASAAIVCDVQNTLVNYPINRYGSTEQKSSICRCSLRIRSVLTRYLNRGRGPTHSDCLLVRKRKAIAGF